MRAPWRARPSNFDLCEKFDGRASTPKGARMFEVEAVTDLMVIEVAGVVRGIRGDAELARQMRNSTQSVSSNVGEAAGRFGKDRRLHFSYAYGSARELRQQLKFAVAFGHVEDASIERLRELLDRVCAMLWKLTHLR